jgi:replicative superfamily II helicase
MERMFRNGIIKVIFATATLAVGIHMPCKTGININIIFSFILSIILFY